MRRGYIVSHVDQPSQEMIVTHVSSTGVVYTMFRKSSGKVFTSYEDASKLKIVKRVL